MKRKPVFGNRPFGKRDARLLLVAYFDPNGIETIPEGIEAWQALSRHEIILMNLWPGREGRLKLPNDLDLRRFEGIIIHPTVSYSPASVGALDDGLQRSLAHFDGVKILMKQDEQVLAGMHATLVHDKGFDVVCTCVPLAGQEKVYPRAVIGEDCTLVQTLTGYVSAGMRHREWRGNRDLGLTYRGSIQPLAFGRLGYEKRGIGYDVAGALTTSRSIRHDISSRWEDRLSGPAWTDFLARSAVVLGVESGANLFDFDGSVAEWCKGFDSRHCGEDVTTYAYYKRAHDELLYTVEGNVDYAQISPRHFEAAAAGAAQLLYEGEYSGLFEPHRHFFPLARDLSNFDAVSDFLRDEHAQRRMADCAFEEIILNRENWYEGFVVKIDGVIDSKLSTKGRRPAQRIATEAARPLVYVLCAHDPTIDPRIGWFADTLAKTCRVVVIGTYKFNVVGKGPSFEVTANGIGILRVERTQHDAEWLSAAGELRERPLTQSRALLASLVGYSALPDELLRAKLGADVAVASELARFREICAYMVNTNAALIGAVEKLGAPNLVVAADLEALYAAVNCGESTGARVVFDAHEYWPWSYTDFQHWEIEFWGSMEGRLVSQTDLNLAVTPQLADLMGQEYGVKFRSLPNAATLGEGQQTNLQSAFRRRANRKGPIRILYQGSFAQGRGLEEVINACRHMRTRVQLILRGPDNDYKESLIELARSMGLNEDRVLFAPPVSEAELIPAALDADVGLIPYNPAWFGYRYCCPNKLSQYAAAGLPIMSSSTQFVARTVADNEIGVLVDITDPELLAKQIDNLSDRRRELVRIGRRARAFFEKSFNWEKLAAPVVAEIGAMLDDSPHRKLELRWLEPTVREDRVLNSPAVPPPPGVFGGRTQGRSEDVLLFEEGSKLVGSSPFHEFPHDAGYLLRREKSGGYAAAQETGDHPQWIEFDMGSARPVDRLRATWYDAFNFPKHFRILGRTLPGTGWHTLCEMRNADGRPLDHRMEPIAFRYLRIEAFEFVGQQRLLIRGLRATEAQHWHGDVLSVGTSPDPYDSGQSSVQPNEAAPSLGKPNLAVIYDLQSKLDAAEERGARALAWAEEVAAKRDAADERAASFLALADSIEVKRAASDDRVASLLTLSEELEKRRATAEERVASLLALSEDLEERRATAEERAASLLALSEVLEERRATAEERVASLLALSEELEERRATAEERVASLLALCEENEARRSAAEGRLASLLARTEITESEQTIS